MELWFTIISPISIRMFSKFFDKLYNVYISKYLVFAQISIKAIEYKLTLVKIFHSVMIFILNTSV